MQAQTIQQLFAYHRWANSQLMGKIVELSPSQLTAQTWLSQKTIFATAAHLLDVQWSWRMACQEGIMPSAVISEADFDSIHAFNQAWQRDDQALLDYVASLDDQKLLALRPIAGVNLQPRPYWQILFHTCNHATHHRAEIGQYLATIEHSPGDLDFTHYLRVTEPNP